MLQNHPKMYVMKNPSQTKAADESLPNRLMRGVFTGNVNSSIPHDVEIGQLQFIEVTRLSSSSPNKTNGVGVGPDSQASNTSESIHEDHLSVSLFPEENSVQEQQSSIFKRIVKNHELRYMACLPENNESNRNKYKFTSIITSQGLYQMNREVHEWMRILTVEQLEQVASVLVQSNKVERDDGLAYDDLTLNQLKELDKVVRDHRGYTIIGYSINEEVFLNIIGLGQFEFPPEPGSYPKQLLETVNLPIVKDVSISLRSSAMALILFEILAAAYLLYDTRQQGAYDNFYYNNVQLFFCVTSSVAIAELFLLRSGIFKREMILSGITRFRLIEESMIGMSTNWATYSLLLNLPENIVGYGNFPVLLYALYHGWYNDNSLYTTSVMNIANRPRLKTAWNGLAYALKTGSFFSLGLLYYSLDIISADPNTDDVQIGNNLVNTLAIIQYITCVITIVPHLARYPYNSSQTQRIARYASNTSNALGNVMLDNYAMFVIISMLLEITIGPVITPQQTGLLTLFFGLQVTVSLYSFLTAFPTTPDLPEFSIVLMPEERTMLATFFKKIESVRQLFRLNNPITSESTAVLTHTTSNEGSIIGRMGGRFRLFPIGGGSTSPTDVQRSTLQNPMHSMSLSSVA